MDPDRCGLLPFTLEPDFGYRDYVEWAVDIPMFFVVREGRYLPATHLTFRDFLERGLEGNRATVADWNLHLTTLFPEVRLKGVIEVRGSDAVPPSLICALPALWKGVLYDAQAREAAWKLVERWTPRQREELLAEVARSGLAGSVAGRPVLEVAREFTEISAEGLRRIAERGESAGDERPFLEPLHEQLERGASPGEVLLAAWREEWRGDLRRMIEHVRY
jgi:glutamate--cysteine ligase